MCFVFDLQVRCFQESMVLDLMQFWQIVNCVIQVPFCAVPLPIWNSANAKARSFYEGPSDSLFAWNTRELDHHHLLSSKDRLRPPRKRKRDERTTMMLQMETNRETERRDRNIFNPPPPNSQKINTQQQAKITRRTTQKQQYVYFTTITTKKHPSTVSCVDNYYNKLHSNLRQNIYVKTQI